MSPSRRRAEQSRHAMTDEREKAAAALKESLSAFAGLREQMREDGPGAVVEALAAMPEGDLRQVLFALVVTTERAEHGEQG